MVVILMGVSGSGKTTVGLALAQSLRWEFADADDYHSPENVAKMRAGIPLNDADRAPWLAILRDLISGWLSSKTNVVLACSALKQTYREELNTCPEVRFIYLRGDKELIAERLSARPGHYMDPHLLDSQFASLEEPHDVVVVDVRSPVAESVAQIRRELGLEPQP